MSKPRLLFVKHKGFNARTVDNDLEILKERYDVRLYNSAIGRGPLFLIGFMYDFLFLIFNIHRFKILFIWFGDYHAYLPALLSKLFSKKCILCLGGYDAHWIVPDKANTLKEKLRKFCVLESIKYASIILPVSNWLATFVKHLKSSQEIQVAYCCVNPLSFLDNIDEVKENCILTVGGGGIMYETKRKKLDFFIETANFFYETYPEYNASFLIVGHEPGSDTYQYLNRFIKNPNTKILPIINNPLELKRFYGKAKVYCQFSEYEAFGIAIIEAMANRTIPIVFNGGAMPEVINNTGLVINEYSVETAASLIKDILDNKYEPLRDKARKRVIDNFTIEKRKEIIFKYI